MKKFITKISLLAIITIITACSSETSVQPLLTQQDQISQLSSNISKPAKNSQITKPTKNSSGSLASFIRFDVKNPEVQKFIQTKGLDKKGYQISVNKADLVYTTNNWKTTLTSSKQYLIDNTEGFILRDIAPETSIEYSVHAYLCLSYDHFYSCADKAELWVNNNGKNYQGKTTAK